MNKFIIITIIGLFISSANIVIAQASSEMINERCHKISTPWTDRSQAPVIESVRKLNGQVDVELSNGTSLQLLPVYYYVAGWDEGDWNQYYLFRREFASMKLLFELNDQLPPYHGVSPYHKIEFIKGQKVQVVVPTPASVSDNYTKVVNQRDGLELWSWLWNRQNINKRYMTLPLNFYETSVNRAPLHVNLYEHPEDENFFNSAFPSSTDFSFLAHAHLTEASLMKFEDVIEAVSGDTLQLKNSQIHASLTEEAKEKRGLQFWKCGDAVSACYRQDGQYQLLNHSQGGLSIEAYLSDPAFSDLRNYPISSNPL